VGRDIKSPAADVDLPGDKNRVFPKNMACLRLVPSKSKHQTLNNKRLNHTRIKQGFEQEKPV